MNKQSQRADDGAASRLFGFGDIAHPLEGYTFHLIAELLNPRSDFLRDPNDVHGFVDRLGSNANDFSPVVAFHRGWSLRESNVGYGRQRYVGSPRSADFDTFERVYKDSRSSSGKRTMTRMSSTPCSTR